MRTNEVLLEGFNDLKTLLQYLYMDENHFVVVNNGLCDLKLNMDENLRIWCRNMNFPEFDSTVREIQLAELLAIVEQLKQSKPTEFPKSFESRWEEIKMITTSNVPQNEMKIATYYNESRGGNKRAENKESKA